MSDTHPIVEHSLLPPAYSEFPPVAPIEGQVAPPPYSEFLTYTPPAGNRNQAVYPQLFDTSIIPRGNILTPLTAQPIHELSTIDFQTDSDGTIKCFDPVLDENPDEIFRFFMSHLEAPSQLIFVHCTHEESTTVSDGENGTRTETKTVTDISFKINVSSFVSRVWSQIACVPESGKESKSFRETLEEYCHSKNVLKE